MHVSTMTIVNLCFKEYNKVSLRFSITIDRSQTINLHMNFRVKLIMREKQSLER